MKTNSRKYCMKVTFQNSRKYFSATTQ